jgi:hypothetical protein
MERQRSNLLRSSQTEAMRSIEFQVLTLLS